MDLYRKEILLGEGTYGKVWLVEKEGKYYALKETIFNEIEDNLAEIYIAMENRHPNLIRGEDFFFTQISPMNYTLSLVLELAEQNLHDFLRENLQEDTKVRLFYELLSAVHFLHKSHFYHCDIKPDNILIREGVVKLADFSLTRFFHSPPNACQSTIYAPPEIFAERVKFVVPDKFLSIFYQPIDRRYSDIWACGAVFVYMLTGRDLISLGREVEDYLAFVENPVAYLVDIDVPEEFFPILLKILQPQEKYRVRTVKEILNHEFFLERSYQKPIRGFNLWRPLRLRVTVNRLFRRDFSYLHSILEHYVPDVFIFNSTVNLFYRLYEELARGRSKEEVLAFIYACFTLSQRLYSLPAPLEEVLANVKGGPSIPLIIEKSVAIVKAMKGMVYFPTFATLAFSRLAVEKSHEILLDPEVYPQLDIISYMKELEAKETPIEREFRQPITYFTEE